MRTSLVLLALTVSACLRPDPNHCANLDGDLSCAEGMFCSSCEGQNAGCVEAMPSVSCAVPGPDPSSTGNADSVTTESTSTSTQECTMDAALDGACPQETPICDDGTCISCVEADVCEGSVCVEEWNRCAECSPFTDEGCEAERWCGDDFLCGGCTRHDQCPDSACDLMLGECMPADRVFVVDNGVCPSEGEGSVDAPFCELESVLSLSVTPGGAVATAIVLGGTAPYPVSANLVLGRRVAILGRGNVTLGDVGATSPIFNLGTGSSQLYLENVTVSRAPSAGLRCAGGSGMWIDSSVVRGNGIGIDAQGCDVVMRGSQVLANDGDGVLLSGGASLRMESSTIVGNGSVDTDTVALRSTASSFEIRFSTIVGNDAELGGGGASPLASVLCTGGIAGPIRNSVVVAPGLASISCPWAEFSRSFIDTPGLDTPDSLVAENWDATWFEDLSGLDVHIRNPESNPWRELARWELGDPQRDLDGTSRRAVPGSLGAAGADAP